MGIKFDKWNLLDTDNIGNEDIAKLHGFPDILGKILSSRGIRTDEEIYSFLNPDLRALPLPDTMKDVKKAAKLVCDAIAADTKIVIFGDYDADGITGTALLVNFLKKTSAKVHYCHPKRLSDGYGLGENNVIDISNSFPKCLLITVDCGISDTSSVALAKERGLSVIVTDHHQPPEKLPEADAVVNPAQKDCRFPFKGLAGVGVAFYLAIAIRSELREKGVWTNKSQPNLKELLDLVAIGSVADMVPLLAANRILVKVGLDSINDQKGGSAGIKALLEASGFQRKRINSEEISFQIGPRLNATGRLDDATLATRLLTTTEESEATSLGAEINEINEKRKGIADDVTQQALIEAQKQIDKNGKVIVIHGEEWHQGIIGIVASKLCEIAKRPVIVLAGTPVAKGSARTIPSINIYNLLQNCKNILQFGGHKQAAGLTIRTESINDFTEEINLVASKIVSSKDSQSELLIDGIFDHNITNELFYEKYRQLMPFGIGNPEPVFVLPEPCQLRNIRVVGKNKDHISFSVMLAGENIYGIGFGLGDLVDRLLTEKVSLAFSFRKNVYRGRKNLQLFVHDMNFS